MLVFGGVMWSKATTDDPFFEYVINGGDLLTLLKKCDKSKYIGPEDPVLLELLSAVFQYEKERLSVHEVRAHSWLRN